MIFGYARVSTEGQSLAAQEEALKAAGVERLFREKISGVKTRRPELDKMLAELHEGDVVVVSRLDRLARSTRDLLNILHQVSERGASFKSLADTWADTTSPHGRLMVTMLAGLAEFERSLIVTRTTEGRRRAKAAGRKLGPKFKLTPHQRSEVLRALEEGAATQAELSRRYNVSEATISRLAKRLG